MLKEITIKNFKSIVHDTIELSNVNVFIGENGCGKSNILEAFAMMSESQRGRFDGGDLEKKGMRVTKPALTTSSFIDLAHSDEICLAIQQSLTTNNIELKIVPEEPDNIYSKWLDKNNIKALIENASRSLGILSSNGNTSIIHNLAKLLINQTSNLVEETAISPDYLIYNLNTLSLRGIQNISKTIPLGIHGEGLDVLINDFSEDERKELVSYSHLISWLDEFFIDQQDRLKYEGHKLERSISTLYFKDRFMNERNNTFAAENSNEGVLHILFYLALLISRKTPKFFAIDNIESALNPQLCRILMKTIAELAVKHDKQVLITTHNPAILDGLNLFDDHQRLLVVSRNDEGHTQTKRVKLKPTIEGKDLKLSEMWMRGYLGGLPNNF